MGGARRLRTERRLVDNYSRTLEKLNGKKHCIIVHVDLAESIDMWKWDLKAWGSLGLRLVVSKHRSLWKGAATNTWQFMGSHIHGQESDSAE